MSVGKEWEIPLRQTQQFCPENSFLGELALKTPIQKFFYLHDMGPFRRYYHMFLVCVCVCDFFFAAIMSVEGQNFKCLSLLQVSSLPFLYVANRKLFTTLNNYNCIAGST